MPASQSRALPPQVVFEFSVGAMRFRTLYDRREGTSVGPGWDLQVQCPSYCECDASWNWQASWDDASGSVTMANFINWGSEGYGAWSSENDDLPPFAEDWRAAARARRMKAWEATTVS